MPLPNAPRDYIQWLDLTRLQEGDTADAVKAFCQKGQTPLGPVAAVCVYSEFLPDIVPMLQDTDIGIATVVNFPHGLIPAEVVGDKIHDAIEQGATEIDVVMPYSQLKTGDEAAVFNFVAHCRQRCKGALLKVIIESGELSPEQIRTASDIVIAANADFIKTSTGKTEHGASLEAVKILLTSIQNSNKKVGIKVSGGIRSLETAMTYVELVHSMMGDAFLDARTFRIGASSLLDDILNAERATTG